MDWRSPDYSAVYAERLRRLERVQSDRSFRAALWCIYREEPWRFIEDWGCTVDPRNAVDPVRPVMVPFILFPKQREWLEWVVTKWQRNEPGLTEKSRDCGASWLSVSLACTLCTFRSDLNIGFGSRKEEYVDKGGSPKSLFWKGRQFMLTLPPIFRAGWNERQDSAHMRLSFPQTGSTITGEAGDNIGRGDRAALYFVDEAAFLERPQLVEASLSQTTNCRMDISSANGMANPFAEKRFGGKIEVFTFHWREDPRKGEAWYQKQCDELDSVTVAQEIDINYSASAVGVLIPSEWVQAAIDAHLALGIPLRGQRRGAMDVADEGIDKNAFGMATGVIVERVEEWSGKGSDIFASVERVFDLCDEWGVLDFRYDADGVGADVRGNARVINERRAMQSQTQIRVMAFRGSGEVQKPQAEDVPGRANEDFFMNFKAQAWWSLRRRFYHTYRAVVHGDTFDPDFIISLSKGIPNLGRLTMELCQPTYVKSINGKIVVDKKPSASLTGAKVAMKSPNLADAVMMLYAPMGVGTMRIADEALEGV